MFELHFHVQAFLAGAPAAFPPVPPPLAIFTQELPRRHEERIGAVKCRHDTNGCVRMIHHSVLRCNFESGRCRSTAHSWRHHTSLTLASTHQIVDVRLTVQANPRPCGRQCDYGEILLWHCRLAIAQRLHHAILIDTAVLKVGFMLLRSSNWPYSWTLSSQLPMPANRSDGHVFDSD